MLHFIFYGFAMKNKITGQIHVTLLLILSCNNSFRLNITLCCQSSLLSSFPLLGLWTFVHEKHFLANACFVLLAHVWRRLLPTSPGPAKEDGSVLKMQRHEPERRPLLCLVWGQGTCSCCLWDKPAAASLQQCQISLCKTPVSQ